GLVQRACDPLLHRLEAAVAPRGEVGVDALVVRQCVEEGYVGDLRPTDRDRHRPVAVAPATSRALRRTTPEPSATPPRMKARQSTAAVVIGSPSNVAPYARAKTGIRKVTRLVRRAPAVASRRKRTSCARAVPMTASASSDAVAFHPGACGGSCTSA